MRRSHYRRASNQRASAKPKWFTSKRGIIAAAATLAVFGGIVTISQVSNASTIKKGTQKALAACDNIKAPSSTKLSTKTKPGTWTTNGGKVTQHADDGAGDVPSQADMRNRCRTWVMQNVASTSGSQNNGGQSAGASPAASGSANAGGAAQNGGGGNNAGGNNAGGNNAGGNNNGGAAATPPPGAGLGVLANSCDNSKLPLFDGFQKGDRCVTTEFGEVGSAANNPSLLITSSPKSVGVNTPFTLKVSTRNLIRDRFLAAGAGGYYVESSVLEGGIVRGHFHTACRMLDSTTTAPAPDPVPAFFVATEDSKGGKTPDTVTINVPGLPEAGQAQCAAWAGDGSHRIPMMERANMTPAIDSVRVTVRDGGGGGDQNNGGGDQNNGGGGTNNGGANNGGGATTPPTKPPATKPPATGGNNGGQQGGNNNNGGGNNNNGGNNKPPTTAPTTAPTKAATSGDDIKSVIVKPKPSVTTEAPAKSGGTTTRTTSGDDESTYDEPAPTKTKKSTAAAATSDDKANVSDDGATLDKDAQPDAQAAPKAQTIDAAPKAATTKSSLALTGTNTVMVIGVGAILLIIGLIVFTTTRRRPGGYR